MYVENEKGKQMWAMSEQRHAVLLTNLVLDEVIGIRQIERNEMSKVQEQSEGKGYRCVGKLR